MLYNKDWDKTHIKPDVFSLESLIAWLEKQPARKSYDFFCPGECLLGQWTRSIDPAATAADVDNNAYYYKVNGTVVDLRQHQDIAMTGNWSFGAALDRARKALGER